jgi:hypothetical protein
MLRRSLNSLETSSESREVKVLAVLDYMFHGGCRRVSRVLSMGSEPISKSAVHYLSKKVSKIRVAT